MTDQQSQCRWRRVSEQGEARPIIMLHSCCAHGVGVVATVWGEARPGVCPPLIKGPISVGPPAVTRSIRSQRQGAAPWMIRGPVAVAAARPGVTAWALRLCPRSLHSRSLGACVDRL
jgi:hypothetical protein